MSLSHLGGSRLAEKERVHLNRRVVGTQSPDFRPLDPAPAPCAVSRPSARQAFSASALGLVPGATGGCADLTGALRFTARGLGARTGAGGSADGVPCAPGRPRAPPAVPDAAAAGFEAAGGGGGGECLVGDMPARAMSGVAVGGSGGLAAVWRCGVARCGAGVVKECVGVVNECVEGGWEAVGPLWRVEEPLPIVGV